MHIVFVVLLMCRDKCSYLHACAKERNTQMLFLRCCPQFLFLPIYIYISITYISSISISTYKHIYIYLYHLYLCLLYISQYIYTYIYIIYIYLYYLYLMLLQIFFFATGFLSTSAVASSGQWLQTCLHSSFELEDKHFTNRDISPTHGECFICISNSPLILHRQL